VIYYLSLIGFIILVSFTGHLFRKKTRIPETLFLITFGLFIGPVSGSIYGTSLVPVESFRNITGLVTTIALIIILLESGFEFDIFDIAKTFSKATFFTVTTFLLTTGFVSLFMMYAVGWPALMSLLLGVVSSGTTTVTVSHLIANLKMKGDVKQLLVLESIINDLTIVTGGVIITRFIIAEQNLGAALTLQEITATIFSSVLIAIGGGAVFFLVWIRTLKLIERSPMKFAYTVGMLFIMYDAIEFLEGSGPIAVLIFSLFVGNSAKLVEKLGLDKELLDLSSATAKSIEDVLDDISFFVKTFFFVFLGILFDPSLITASILWVLAGILTVIVIGRYISSKILAWRYSDVAPYSKIIAIMLPRGFTATVVAFLPSKQGIDVPGFTEIILLMVFFTTIIAIVGTALYARTHPQHQ